MKSQQRFALVSYITPSVRNLRDLVMYLMPLLFKMLEQARILLLGLPLSTLILQVELSHSIVVITVS